MLIQAQRKASTPDKSTNVRGRLIFILPTGKRRYQTLLQKIFGLFWIDQENNFIFAPRKNKTHMLRPERNIKTTKWFSPAGRYLLRGM
jgi:hypothetical protein